VCSGASERHTRIGADFSYVRISLAALRAQAGCEKDGRKRGHQNALREFDGAIGYAHANLWLESAQTCHRAVAKASGSTAPKAIAGR